MAGSDEIPRDAEPSTASRLARRVIDRVTERLNERFHRADKEAEQGRLCRLAARLQSRLRCRRREGEQCQEKLPFKKLPRWMVLLGAANRIWQFLCAIVFYSAFICLLFDESGGEGSPLTTKAIESLAYGTLLCSSIILLVGCLTRMKPSNANSQWYLVATFLDVWMIMLASCKLHALRSDEALASCRPKETAPYVKSMFKNGAAFAYSRFGWGHPIEPETIDLHCSLPKIVAILICFVILSYAASIFLNLLFLLRGREAPVSDSLPGYIEEAIPVNASHSHALPPTPRVSLTVSRHSVSSRPSMAEEEPKYTNLEDIPFPSSRLSQETTSSFNPDLYLVSDGFRPDTQPPHYSRPPSYRSNRSGPPSYSSRPSSLRNEY